jgi:mono/diheme cytochrome c family protein
MAQQKPTSSSSRDSKQSARPRGWLNQRVVIIGFVLVCLLTLAVFVVRSAARPTTVAADRADVMYAALVERGRQIYTTRCASCHGGDLKGEPGWPQPHANGVMPAAPLDASGPIQQRDDQWIFITIKQGGQATAAPGSVSTMPAFGSLTDAEVWALISYIKSTWP